MAIFNHWSGEGMSSVSYSFFDHPFYFKMPAVADGDNSSLAIEFLQPCDDDILLADAFVECVESRIRDVTRSSQGSGNRMF